MEKEKQNKQNKPDKEKKEGYIIVTNHFLKKWVSILGVGPVVLYQELLTYCHKGKVMAWPTIDSLCKQMGIAKTTLLRYQNTLLKFGLIKNIRRAKSTTGHYRNNIYQITPLEELSGPPDPDKIIDFIGSKMKPDRYQNDTSIGSNMKLSLVSKRYPNNTNLNITNSTAATKREKEAVVAVNFKKLKEKGEEKMQVIRERMVELDFKEEFIEKILKEYSTKKIDKKLDLLMDRRNIQNPAGWLRTALKNDYPTPHPHLNPPPSRGRRDGSLILSHSIRGRRFVDCPAQKEEEFKEDLETGSQLSPSKWTSREAALEAIGLIRDNLSLPVYPSPLEGKGKGESKVIANDRRECGNLII